MREDLQSRLYIVSKSEIDENLRKRIRRWARQGRIIFGPIEVKKYRERENYYSMDIILHTCIEDEQGAHDFKYNDVTFEKRKSA